MKKPIKPVQEWDELVDESVTFYSGISVEEILKLIGEDIDLSKATFEVNPTYYDEVEYSIKFKRLVHRKMTDEAYAKKLASYEKKMQ